ncbi:hypothetical protein ACFYOC_25390 [Nocardiopsis alba]|uniref:hypothetical protein n=1 Tax=Nocardiopsis alba TaxID=53437 RepID=UPI0036B0FACB
MAMRRVRMVHENVRGVYDAPASAVDHWKARGWRREDEKPAPKTAARMTAKAEKGGDRG